ncbi:MAG: hypothetical protein FWG75_09890 [Cystobacterineae bacterium]|nr:hypothetical protein [Cystobacterineae bacterium]
MHIPSPPQHLKPLFHPGAAWLLALLWCLLPSPSWAWPVDMEFLLKEGQTRFVKLPAAEWLEVDEPSIATAELFETQEVLLEAKKPGMALVLVYAEGKMGIWRLRVEHASPPKPAQNTTATAAHNPGANPLVEAQQACPKLLFQTHTLPKISGNVDTEACRKALLFLLMQPGWLAKELELVFETETLASQLKEIHHALEQSLGPGKLTLRYVGATLEMSGKLSPAEHRKALWGAFFHAAGRIALDDGIHVVPPPSTLPPKILPPLTATPKEKKP